MTTPTPYTGPERRESDGLLATELREYRQSVEALTERVASLTDNTRQLNEIADRQSRQEVVSQAALTEATKALVVARHTDENAAPLKAVEAKWRSDAAALLSLQERIAARAKRVGWSFFAVSMVLLVVSVTVISVIVNRVNDGRTAECEQRVRSSYDTLAGVDRVNQTVVDGKTDPALVAFINQLRGAAERGTKVDC